MKNSHSTLQNVVERISQAAKHSGRTEKNITLVAVSKQKPIEDIIVAYEAGVRNFGENRSEELEEKATALSHLTDLKWHFIGNLQSRQSSLIAQYAHYFHAIDRFKIVQRLSEQLTTFNRSLSVFIQVNVSGEASKNGFQCDNWQHNADQSINLIQTVKEMTALPHINLLGLMTMAPFNASEDIYRNIFKNMAGLSTYLREQLPEIPAQQLSMGMSDDFEIAIEEGATYVRIGSAIFGERAK